MSDSEEPIGAMEELLSRHRKEKKDMKEKVLNMKKAAKCGNKQKQKETSAAIEEMEKAMVARHEKELQEVKASSSGAAETDIPQSTSPVKTDNTDDAGTGSFYKETQVNAKAKKRQAKKDEAARRMKEAIQEDRANATSSLRFIEMAAINKELDEEGLQLFDIAPDGDCLYNAVANQLSKTINFESVTGKDLRRRAARYLLDNKTEFAPFLTNDVGEPLDVFEFETYCDKVEKEAKEGGTWGGEPELNALSRSLERRIVVIQPEGRKVIFGNEFTTKPLTIVYHRHAYQLGEHYNSTQPKTLCQEA